LGKAYTYLRMQSWALLFCFWSSISISASSMDPEWHCDLNTKNYGSCTASYNSGFFICDLNDGYLAMFNPSKSEQDISTIRLGFPNRDRFVSVNVDDISPFILGTVGFNTGAHANVNNPGGCGSQYIDSDCSLQINATSWILFDVRGAPLPCPPLVAGQGGTCNIPGGTIIVTIDLACEAPPHARIFLNRYNNNTSYGCFGSSPKNPSWAFFRSSFCTDAPVSNEWRISCSIW